MKKIVMMREAVIRFIRDERGLAAVEYAIIAGVIATGIALVFTNIGSRISVIMGEVLSQLGGSA